MSDQSKSESRGNRWWENYVVRYFVGTVFGAGIAIILTAHSSSPLKGTLQAVAGVQEATFKDIAVFASIGFAFCYVASAPILTVHALREHMRVRRLLESPVRWLVATLLVIAASYVAVNNWFTKPPLVSWIASLSVFSIIAFQLVQILTALANRLVHVREFYEGLSAARASTSARAHEYVESYRHLREHGNAFLILVLEAALGLALASAPSAEAAILILVAWVLPATSAWIVGASLEADFAHATPITPP